MMLLKKSWLVFNDDEKEIHLARRLTRAHESVMTRRNRYFFSIHIFLRLHTIAE